MLQNQITYFEWQNPMFLHPSDGPASISLEEKLIGAANYRSWRRSMEIHLASKRKLGFVTGTVMRPEDDPVQLDLWDTSNNTVICWIIRSVSDSIQKLVLFIDSAREIWLQLETRFSVSNGSRRYKLNKEVYGLKQQNTSVSEFYTNMKCLWEELDSMENFPKINNITTEMHEFFKAFNKHKDDQKLFQFLNGLNGDYNAHISQILLMNPLPSAETACSILQQEESQKEILDLNKLEIDSSALYIKSESSESTSKCDTCGVLGHVTERCWTVIGYPKWHQLHKKFPQKDIRGQGNSSGQNKMKGKEKQAYGQANVASPCSSMESTDGGVMSLTPQQIEQLLQLLPGSSNSPAQDSDTDDEIEANFAGSKAGDQTPRDHYHHHDHDHDQLKEQILPVQLQPAESHRIDIIDPQQVLGSITGSYNGTHENDTTPCMVLDWSGKDQNYVESLPSDHITDNVLIVVDEKLHKGKGVNISGEGVKKIGPYTSTQSILLVGEGDFSFSASLAVAFGSASNIVATSLNSQDFLNTNYANFPNNKMELVSRGSVVLHGVDATKMAKQPRLRKIKFDRIIYNFPHSGFNRESRESEISRHQKLVSGFLRNAKKMVEEDGEIHVTHKSNGSFLEWDIPNLGSKQGLNLIQEVKFKRNKYPGYHTKYGFGGDKDFDCTPCKTYKFALPYK